MLNKQTFSDSISNLKSLWIGAQQLVENAALLAVSGFTVWSLLNFDMAGTWIERVLLVAASIVALRGLAGTAKNAIGVARSQSESTAKRYGARPVR